MADDAVWIPVLPSLKDFGRKLDQGTKGAGKDTGERIGREIATGIERSEAAVKKATSTAEKAHNRVADAAGRVRVAEEQLAAARDSGDTVKIARAEENLASQRRRLSERTDDAERADDKLADSRKKLTKVTEQSEEAARENARAIEANADAAGELDSQLGGAIGSLGKFAGAAAGAAGVAGTLMAGMDFSGAVSLMNAQLGATGDAAAALSDEVATVLQSGVAGSAGEAAEAVGALSAQFDYLGFEGEQTASELSDNFLAFTRVFGVDMAEATQMAGQLVTNGLASDVESAADLMTAAMQRVPMAMRDELPDIMNEYGTHFRALGLSGEESFGLLVSAADQGKWALDKTGDALKEFTIRGSDMSKSSTEAYQLIGLSAEDMANKITTGGPAAKEALQQTAEGLLGIKDPAERANAAIALFGTPLEDLSVDQIPQFLEGLSGADDAMSGFEGSSQQLADTVSNSLQGRLDALKGTVTALAGDAFMALWDAGVKVADWAQNNEAWLGPLVAAVGGAAAVWGAWTLAIKAWQAATIVATAAQVAYNAVMSANPVMLIVMAIAALVAGLVYFFTQTELGQQIWAGFMDFLGAAWEWLSSVFAPVWGLIAEGAVVAWELIKAGAQIAWDLFTGYYEWLFSIFATVWGWISEGATIAWELIKSGAQFLWDMIVGFHEWLVATLTTVWSEISGRASAAWNLIVASAQGLWDKLTSVYNWLRDSLGSVWEWIKSKASSAINGIVESFQRLITKAGEIPSKIKGFFSDAGSWLRDAGSRIVSGLWSGIQNSWSMVSGGIQNLLSKLPGASIFSSNFGGSISAYAAGGIQAAESYANGGSRLPRHAVIQAPVGTNGLVQWAEAGTGGEAFLPMRQVKSRTPRAMAILGTVAAAAGARVVDAETGVEVPQTYSGGLGPQAGVATFLDGGVRSESEALKWVRGQTVAGVRPPMGRPLEGSDYVWGGGSDSDWGDCSGMISLVAGFIKGMWDGGRSLTRLFATGSQGSVLRSMGFRAGRKTGPGIFSTGFFNGGPYGGHTAGNIGNTRIEMGGARGNGQIDGQAAGTLHPSFTDHYWIPLKPDGPTKTDLAFANAGLEDADFSVGTSLGSDPNMVQLGSDTPVLTNGASTTSAVSAGTSAGAKKQSVGDLIGGFAKTIVTDALGDMLGFIGLEDLLKVEVPADLGSPVAVQTDRNKPVPDGVKVNSKGVATLVGSDDDTVKAATSMSAPKTGIATVPAGSISMGEYKKGAQFYISEIVAAAIERSFPAKGAAIGVGTSLVETGNPPKMYASSVDTASQQFPYDAIGSDHDSSGLFQQRDNGAWGTIAQRMNARASASMFFNALAKKDWENMGRGAAAQSVQVSAFPDKYAKVMSIADRLVADTRLYDQGGYLPSGALGLNLSGQPEPVFTHNQWRVLEEASRVVTEFADTLADSGEEMWTAFNGGDFGYGAVADLLAPLGVGDDVARGLVNTAGMFGDISNTVSDFGALLHDASGEFGVAMAGGDDGYGALAELLAPLGVDGDETRDLLNAAADNPITSGIRDQIAASVTAAETAIAQVGAAVESATPTLPSVSVTIDAQGGDFAHIDDVAEALSRIDGLEAKVVNRRPPAAALTRGGVM